MTSVTSGTTYAIPYWLGGYVASVSANSVWTLPLTYPNGGKTPVGADLVVENLGPGNITIVPTSPETIQASGSYLVPSGTTVSILSYSDWLVTSSPTVGSTGGQINANTTNIGCWLNVGGNYSAAQKCGDVGSKRVLVGNSAVDPWQSIPNLGGFKFGSIGSWSNYSLDTASTCGQINEISGYVENSGTCAAVAGFFFGRGNHVWGVNEIAYSTCPSCTAIGNELDFGNLAATITRTTSQFTLPVAKGGSVAVISTAGAPATGIIIISNLAWYTYTSIDATNFLGVDYLTGTNTGTIVVNSGITYGLGGNAYGLVLVALGSNVGGSPPQNYIQLQGTNTLANDGIMFSGQTVMPDGTLFRAAAEKATWGMNLLGSTFYGSAIRIPVKSGSTAASSGIEIFPSGDLANGGNGIIISSFPGDAATLRYAIRVSASNGQPIRPTGTVFAATFINAGIGLDFTSASFSTGAIVLNGSSTTAADGIWMGTDIKFYRSKTQAVQLGDTNRTNIEFTLGNNANTAPSIASVGGNLRLGSGVGVQLTGASTSGFPKMPTIAGLSSATPIGAEASSADFYWDNTNFKICAYNQPTSSWKCSGGFTMADEPDVMEMHTMYVKKNEETVALMRKRIDMLEAKLAQLTELVMGL